ncbi:rho guanine nucleotide exchange factor 5-like [Discoglossus pictus]
MTEQLNSNKVVVDYGFTTEEEDERPEKEAVSRPSVTLREKRVLSIKPPDTSSSLHRRHSKLFNSSSLLYQEYSDVALNQEIQKHKAQDSPAEERDPGSPRLRRRALSSQDSYLQRLSISSADSLWQDIPVIRESSTFLSMSREKHKLQEAKFELIMSESLYLRSLNIAVDHFQHNPELHEVLSTQERQWLFSRLSEVRDASSDFLFDLEEEFEGDIYSFQVCNVVLNHEQNFRRVYLPYVTNQSYQERTFQRLLSHNPRFQQVLGKLESDPVCQRLSLKSFLILPFQRITRLRLLLQNILKRSAPGSKEESEATEAHNTLEKLIKDCNESVQRMKDTEELILLNQKIQFECKIFPLISQSRRLVKHGEVSSLEFSNSLTFRWKVTTRPVYLHLFNDCLLLSRLREGGRFVVFDYANSCDVRVERCEMKIHGPQKNTFRVFLKENAAGGRESGADGRETEYIFRTETQSQKLRWISALSPPKKETDLLKYQDLKQVQCLKSYKSRENDELSLDKADIIMVLAESADGWMHGLRLSDLHSGWFPKTHTQAISRHAGLRNLEEEQRLQTLRAKLQPTGAK